MDVTPKRTRAALAVALALTVATVGCGGDAPTETRAGGAAAPTAGASTIVPAVRVTDVATGAPVDLRAQVATDRPTLLWMWAPS